MDRYGRSYSPKYRIWDFSYRYTFSPEEKRFRWFGELTTSYASISKFSIADQEVVDYFSGTETEETWFRENKGRHFQVIPGIGVNFSFMDHWYLNTHIGIGVHYGDGKVRYSEIESQELRHEQDKSPCVEGAMLTAIGIGVRF